MQDNVKALDRCVGWSQHLNRFHVGILEWYLSLQGRHTSIVPVNCNGLERARRRGDIFERAGVDVSVSTI